MKKLMQWAAAHLLAFLYLLALALWALCALAGAGIDAAGYAMGRLSRVEIPLEQAQLQDILCDEQGRWVAAGSDPQILLETGQPVRSVRWNSAVGADEFEGYYAKAGQDYSLRRRVWAKSEKDGVLFVFPAGSSRVRIDPAENAGVLAHSSSAVLVVNEPLPLWRYFVPRAEQGLALLVLPAAAAAVLDLAGFWIKRYRKGR